MNIDQALEILAQAFDIAMQAPLQNENDNLRQRAALLNAAQGTILLALKPVAKPTLEAVPQAEPETPQANS